MDTLILAIRNLGPMRLAVMGAVFLGMIGFFIFLATRLATPSMVLLYGNLDSGDSSQIIGQLQSRNIPFEQRGADIMVPKDQALKLRLSLANQGLPASGSVGYEIFDDRDALGTTNFVQNVNLVRALEGELARTIKTLGPVRSVRVHLVLPRRELFSREKQQPSASITLKIAGAARLDKGQIAAIQHLTASAVPGLVPSRVSIIDTQGKLLARGFKDDDATELATKAVERRRNFESQLSRTIEDLLGKVVGFGKVRAEIRADMDFDLISTTDEKFDPDGQVVRSTQSVEETNQSRDAEGSPPVTVGTNLPDPSAPAGESISSTAAQSRTEETVNFEVSKKIINHVRESGIVRRLSVAVLIDGVRGIDEDDEPTYQPRSEAEMELLATLVRGVIGFNADRGDTVEVINMEYAEAVEEEVALQLFFGLDKNDLLRMAEVLVLSIVAILVILLVVRPLVSRAFESIPSAAAAGERLLADQAAAAAAALTAPGVPEGMVEEEQFEELIDIDRVEGRVKASSVKKVGEIVEKHPEEALSIIRSWMYQEG